MGIRRRADELCVKLEIAHTEKNLINTTIGFNMFALYAMVFRVWLAIYMCGGGFALGIRNGMFFFSYKKKN